MKITWIIAFFTLVFSSISFSMTKIPVQPISDSTFSIDANHSIEPGPGLIEVDGKTLRDLAATTALGFGIVNSVYGPLLNELRHFDLQLFGQIEASLLMASGISALTYIAIIKFIEKTQRQPVNAE